MRHSLRSRRGVSLIEGLMSTLILLTGMVGVLQGLFVASVQNTMANRHTRASILAQQLVTSVEQVGRSRLLAAVAAPVGTGLFVSPQCDTTVPAAMVDFTGDLLSNASTLPPSMLAQGFTSASVCYIDFDALGTSFRALTPGYSTQDDTTYRRLIAVYRHPSDPAVPIYVAVNVGWRDAGRVRIVKRFTSIYDTTINQTNLEF